MNDLRRHFKGKGEKVDERLLHELLNEIDLDKNGEVNMVEWLQVEKSVHKSVSFNRAPLQLYSGLKGGQISQSRLAKFLADESTTSR